MPCAHNRHVGIRHVVERGGVSPQHVNHGAALLRVSLRGKPRLESGLVGAALQLPQVALERGDKR